MIFSEQALLRELNKPQLLLDIVCAQWQRMMGWE